MTDIERVKRELEEKLRSLSARAVDIDDSLSQPGDDDWDEHAIESADDEALEEVGEATLEEIRQIKAALSQIRIGTYGTCTDCGRAIAEKRMNALPYATKCLNCA